MFVWASASRLPTAIDSTASTIMISDQTPLLGRERDQADPSKRGKACGL